jgi:hypothetical protein
MNQRTPGAERLHRARRAAARELGVKADHPAAIRVATLQVAYDAAQAQLANGRAVDLDSLVRIDAALAAARSSVPHQHTVNIEIVDGTRKTCPFCGVTFNPHDDPPKPLPGDPERDGPLQTIPSNVAPSAESIGPDNRPLNVPPAAFKPWGSK